LEGGIPAYRIDDAGPLIVRNRRNKDLTGIASTEAGDDNGITLAELAKGRVRSWSFDASPFWWRDAPPANGQQASPRATADVVIVGAGYTGLTAALTLARAGRDVIVVDAGVPGFGASTRNGGQVGSGNQKFRVKTLIEMKGERLAVDLLREGVEMLDGIERLIHQEKIDCAFTRCGRFRGAMHPAHYEAMARDMEDLGRYAGVRSLMISRHEQHREVGTDLFFGGSLLPMDASLHPGKYHMGLLARVMEAGCVIHGNTPVRGIISERQGHVLRFGNFEIRTRDVLVATNGYTRDVGAFFRKRIVPLVSAQIATGQIDSRIFEQLMPKRRVVGNSLRVFSYFRAAPNENRLIWGGRGSHLAGDTIGTAYVHLARDLLRAFPALGDVSVSHAWSGRIGYTFDEFPHLGRSPDGVYYAMGYCGTGVSRSTHFGRKIALQMLGRPEGRSAFSDIAFPSHPLHILAEAAVPVIEAWYRLRDTGGF
jgi:glycine/D-amino acid oxidase-like deaminating enzyme